jgi:hypothetical protein
MKKKICGIMIVVLAVVMFATPIYARPEKGQKVPITINWEELSTIAEDPIRTGLVVHRNALINWSVSIDVNGTVAAWTGFSNNTIRKTTNVPGPDGRLLVLQETYDIKITGYTGGFKGSSVIMLDGYPNFATMRARAHGLLRGYGDFAGQTINAGHKWAPIGPPIWNGYLLKPTL